jgi:hypothetical protein
MAIFQFNNQTLPYETVFAPFAHDLLLLQPAKFSIDFWQPVLDSLRGEPSAGGRVVTCESPLPGAEILERFLRTLGLHDLHVVAFGDSVEVVKAVSKIEPGSFERTLLFPSGGPKGAELVREVREFCGI